MFGLIHALSDSLVGSRGHPWEGVTIKETPQNVKAITPPAAVHRVLTQFAVQQKWLAISDEPSGSVTASGNTPIG